MEADRWIDRVQSQRSHLGEITELSTVEAELRTLLKALKDAEVALAPVRAGYEDAASEAQRLRSRASDLERMLSASTANARELSVIQSELAHVREVLDRSEDRELDLLLEQEPLDELIGSVKAQAQPLVERRAELRATITELQGSMDEELIALRRDREDRSKVLSPDLLKKYEAALSRAGTSGAAQVDGGRCDGCRIMLSPLDVDRWKNHRGDTFVTCPECGRLLLP